MRFSIIRFDRTTLGITIKQCDTQHETKIARLSITPLDAVNCFAECCNQALYAGVIMLYVVAPYPSHIGPGHGQTLADRMNPGPSFQL